MIGTDFLSRQQSIVRVGSEVTDSIPLNKGLRRTRYALLAVQCLSISPWMARKRGERVCILGLGFELLGADFTVLTG